MLIAQDLIPELEAACKDLLWRSEADYPFEVAAVPITKAPPSINMQLLATYPDDTPVAIVSLEKFFAQSIVERSWFDAHELSLVKRYRNLWDLLETILETPQVYRIGSVEIDVYLLGKTEDGQVIGVKTKVVET